MECSYSIKDGELVLNNSGKNLLITWLVFIFRFLKFLMLISIFGLITYITYLIFSQCITEVTLAACIPLGSIFATFGSAIISVFSLYCNSQLNLFQENLSALYEQAESLSAWKRWPFLKRYNRKRIHLLKYNYYVLKNPQIVFKGDVFCLAIDIPTCTADFYDIPVLINIMKMLLFHKHFINSVFNHQHIQKQTDTVTFYCILMIYINIIKYKFGTILMLIGAEFVLTSIIFSFFYKSIKELLSLVIAYF